MKGDISPMLLLLIFVAITIIIIAGLVIIFPKFFTNLLNGLASKFGGGSQSPINPVDLV